MYKEGLHSVTIAARIGFSVEDVEEIEDEYDRVKMKEKEAKEKAKRQMPNYNSRSDEIGESYLSRRWHFEH